MPDDGFFSASVARTVRPRPLAIARCDLCGLYAAGCRSPKLPRTGGGTKRVLVVAEAPDGATDAAGDPMASRDTGPLELMLAGVGVDLWRDCVVTHAARCMPPKLARRVPGAHPLDAQKNAVASCLPLVVRDVRESDPTVIIPLGRHAIQSVVGWLWGKDGDVGPVSRWAGAVIPAHAPNAWVCPMYSAADVADDDTGFLADEARRHVGAAAALIGTVPWPDGPPDYPAMVEPIMDPAEAARRLSRYTSGLVAYDFETNMLKPDSDAGHIACASVCWEGQETIAFPWHGPAIPAMRKLLTDPAVGKIMQHATMEIRWTRRKLGVAPVNVRFDTMLGAHAISPRERQKERGGGVTGLKFLAFARLGCPIYNQHLDVFLNGGSGGYAVNRVDEIDPVQLFRYCGMDSLLEYKLAEILSAELGVTIG